MKYIFIMLLIFGCTKKANLDTTSNSWFLKNVDTEIVTVKDIPWEIGKKREAEVSQGFLISLKVPLVTKEDFELLQKKFGIDSLLFEIKKMSGPTPRLLGHLKLPFKNVNRFMHEINFKIMYHSAIVSQRFRRFECPAFKHRKIPQGVEINTKEFHQEPIYLHLEGEFQGMITNVENFPASFSGDLSLTGVFEVKFAFYDSVNKKLYSKFVPVKGRIEVQDEKEVSVPSCAGVAEENEENKDSAPIKLENFQIR